MSKLVKKVTKAVRSVGREIRRVAVPEKVDKAVFKKVGELEDIATGKMTNEAAEEYRQQTAQAEADAKEAAAERKLALSREASRAEKLVASRRRARRAGRRSLLSSGRLGTGDDATDKRTLG